MGLKCKRLAKGIAVIGCVLALGLALTACGSSSSSTTQQNKTDLSGSTLKIYCGAGMTEPFKEIAEAFKTSTGCEMEVTYANAAQIQTQINTTKEGDFFIAGSADELKPVESMVASSTDLVKHIPVLVVQKGNPLGITGVADMEKCSLALVGDPESTPIGKIAKKTMTAAGIWDSMMEAGKISTTTTAPQISAALANGQGDAGIVWKENVKSDSVQIVDCKEMQDAIKTIPAALLTCSSDSKAASAFNEFLTSDEADSIWVKYGYELV